MSQLAADLGVHRTTVVAHLDRHGVPRHREWAAWDYGISMKQPSCTQPVGLVSTTTAV